MFQHQEVSEAMLETLTAEQRQPYDFKKPVALAAGALGDCLFDELIQTRTFQRLLSIRFLGGIDYLIVRHPNGTNWNTRYTRFQHSLGVAKLAAAYCKARELPVEEKRLVVAAALLHDVGHAPLSHSLEPVFLDVFGIEHHRATIAIIRGEALGGEITETLRRHGMDIERLIALISGQDTGFDGFFSGPINFDTIEGVLRTHKFVFAKASVPSPEDVMYAAMGGGGEANRNIVDEFWLLKNFVYQHVINSEDGALADKVCQAFMRNHIASFGARDYFSKEEAVFRKLPGLKELLIGPDFRKNVWAHLDAEILYKSRKFFIAGDSDKGISRYKQEKHDQALSRPVGTSGGRTQQSERLLV